MVTCMVYLLMFGKCSLSCGRSECVLSVVLVVIILFVVCFRCKWRHSTTAVHSYKVDTIKNQRRGSCFLFRYIQGCLTVGVLRL